LVKALAPRRKIEPFDASLLDVLLTSLAITFASARANAAASRQFHFLRTKTRFFMAPNGRRMRRSSADVNVTVASSACSNHVLLAQVRLAGMAVKGLFDRLDRGIDLKRYLRETGRAFLQRRELIVAPPEYLKPRADPTLSLLQCRRVT